MVLLTDVLLIGRGSKKASSLEVAWPMINYSYDYKRNPQVRVTNNFVELLCSKRLTM